MRPARTKEDFPLPEAPTTAMKRWAGEADREVCTLVDQLVGERLAPEEKIGVRLVEELQPFERRKPGDLGSFLRCRRQFEEPLGDAWLLPQVECRHEPGGDRRQIGDSLAELQSTDLSVAVADSDGEFALGKARPAAKKLEQVAKARKSPKDEWRNLAWHGPLWVRWGAGYPILPFIIRWTGTVQPSW